MRVLVTGASGFVGRQAVSALIASGADVHAVSRHALPLDCDRHAADLLDPGAARRIVDEVRPDAILHLAWCVGHGVFWTDPANSDWVAATMTLARAAAEAGCRHVTGVGTCYEYDWPADSDCREGETPLAGHTPYDVAKSRCRSELMALFSNQRVALAWARLFFLYGPHEDPRRLVSSVSRALERGEPAPCSMGLAVRDFMDVRDAGAALAAITLAGATGDINIGSGHGASIAEVASRLGDLAGRRDLIKLGALPDRPDEPPRIVADVTRLKAEVGFRPRFDLENGLRDALAYWRADKSLPSSEGEGTFTPA